MSKTISQVSRMLSVSTRTLRYYEELGLIKSRREADYAYRVYDEDTLLRLRRIVFLRRMRIPLKSIGVLLSAEDTEQAVEVLRTRIHELSDEIAVRKQAISLLTMLENSVRTGDRSWQDRLMQIAPPALPSDTKEELPMAQPAPFNRLTDVRILTLPRMAAASAHYIGSEPENHAGEMMWRFLHESGIASAKPDARVFGFNHPNPSPERKHYGYEFLCTVPDDFDVPAPLTKCMMDGGLYAVHTIKMGDFHEWQELIRWAQESEEYDVDFRSGGMGGLLEEHLNALNWPQEESAQQLDLYLPVKRRTKEGQTP